MPTIRRSTRLKSVPDYTEPATSDSDSDEESYESDEDSEEIDEVSEIEDQNLDEVKLRNKKLVKTTTDSNHMNTNNNNNHDSSCEVIEISSNSNSNQSLNRRNKNNKRRINDDDEEDEADDDTAGKENIEAGNKQSVPSGSDNKKRKLVKESSGASSDSHNLNADVEVTANLPGPSKQVQKASSQEPGEVVRSVIQQPVNFSPRLKELIESFVSAFGMGNSLNSAGGNVWTDELKAMLFRIYQESQSQVERSNMFTYISNKTGKTREVLMRHCRAQSSKLQGVGSSAGSQIQQTQSQVVNKLPTDLKTAYYQKLNDTVSPKVSGFILFRDSLLIDWFYLNF